jgi:SAM-dependent methyltransferase
VRSSAVYSPKAESYAKYRWDYAPAAVETLFEIAGLGLHSAVADLGAGTGILTRRLCGRAGQVFAIEPNPEMRAVLVRDCGQLPGCTVLDTAAEATGLPQASLDAVTAAQAIHWFDPVLTRRELRRILKPGGWLALFENRSTDADLGAALQAISTPGNGVSQPQAGNRPDPWPVEFYFGQGVFQSLRFPFTFQQGWEAFLGAQLSASYNPDPDQLLYPDFVAAARQVFERFSQDGWLRVEGETRLIVGRLQGETSNG